MRGLHRVNYVKKKWKGENIERVGVHKSPDVLIMALRFLNVSIIPHVSFEVGAQEKKENLLFKSPRSCNSAATSLLKELIKNRGVPSDAAGPGNWRGPAGVLSARWPRRFISAPEAGMTVSGGRSTRGRNATESKFGPHLSVSFCEMIAIGLYTYSYIYVLFPCKTKKTGRKSCHIASS